MIAQKGETLTAEEIQQKVKEETETLQRIEEQNVQYLFGRSATVGKTIVARRERREPDQAGAAKISAAEERLYGLSGITFSGERISGRLLKTQLLELEKIKILPGETLQKGLAVQRGLAIKPKAVALSFTSQGTAIAQKNVESAELITGGAVDVDVINDNFDLYFVIPAGQPAGEYSLELTIEKNRRKEHSFPIRLLLNLIGRSPVRVYYAEGFGPFDIQDQGFIFAQQFLYDGSIYSGDFSVVQRIYRDGKKVAEQRYPVVMA